MPALRLLKLTEKLGHRLLLVAVQFCQRIRPSQAGSQSTGQDCGTIIWETKRTKNWGSAWTTKLKEDQREAKAEIAIIVSQCLPEDLRYFDQVNGVWVCEIGCAMPVAAALRHGLIGAAMARLAETGKQGKMEELYLYLCGTEFRQHIEAVVESFVCLETELAKEKRAMEKVWSGREKQIRRALKHTALMYGGIQGIAGRTALPEIQALQIEANSVDPAPLPPRLLDDSTV